MAGRPGLRSGCEEEETTRKGVVNDGQADAWSCTQGGFAPPDSIRKPLLENHLLREKKRLTQVQIREEGNQPSDREAGA